MIEVYVSDINKMTKDYDFYLNAVTPKRREKANRYRNLVDRMRCIAGGLLMKEILGIQSDYELTFHAYGKPALIKGDKFFNLSHAGAYVVLAVDKSPIGVDVEYIELADIAVARRCFQDKELAYLTNGIGNFDEKFFGLWTLKESLMKAVGLGLNLSPESFCVLPWDKPISLKDLGRWYFRQYHPDENHVISVCASHQYFQSELTVVLLS